MHYYHEPATTQEQARSPRRLLRKACAATLLHKLKTLSTDEEPYYLDRQACRELSLYLHQLQQAAADLAAQDKAVLMSSCYGLCVRLKGEKRDG